MGGAGFAELCIFLSDVLLVLAWAQVSVTDVYNVLLCLVSARGPPTMQTRTGSAGMRDRDQNCRELVMCPRAKLLCALVLKPSVRLRDFGWKCHLAWRVAEAPALHGSTAGTESLGPLFSQVSLSWSFLCHLIRKAEQDR